MFAVVKDNIIVDIAWGTEKKSKSIKLNKEYPASRHTLIEVTKENSPMKLGANYIGDAE
jgi:type II restriction/modification system DNA methylase subunit YeeA